MLSKTLAIIAVHRGIIIFRLLHRQLFWLHWAGVLAWMSQHTPNERMGQNFRIFRINWPAGYDKRVTMKIGSLSMLLHFWSRNLSAVKKTGSTCMIVSWECDFWIDQRVACWQEILQDKSLIFHSEKLSKLWMNYNMHFLSVLTFSVMLILH